MNTSGANIATVTLKAFMEGDKITPELRAELQRVLEVTFNGREDTDIVSSLTPPTDLTKIWWPIDPTNGGRIGNPKTYDPATSEWVAFGSAGLPVFNYRKRRNGRQQIASGNGTQIIEFEDILTTAYQVKLTGVFFANGVLTAPPANMNNFYTGIANQTNTSFTLSFYASPTGGMSIDWEVTENVGTNDVLNQQT